MGRRVRAVSVAALVLAAGCDEVTPVTTLPGTIDAELRQLLGQWGVVPIGPVAVQNPAVVRLGQALIFDKVLSGNRDISCATCHDPTLHATDGLPLAVGTGGSGTGSERTLGSGREFVPRNAPTLLNTGTGLTYVFWDGRLTRFGPPIADGVVFPPELSSALEQQAMLPVLNRREMRGNPGDVDVFGNPNELAQFADTQWDDVWGTVMQRLLAIPGYVTLFNAAFPGRSPSTLGFQHAAMAIAAFQKAALTKTDSPFDRYLNRDLNALSPEAKRGGVLFFGQARCASCHSGPLLGGRDFANTGAPQLGPGVGGGAPLDLGRAELFRNSGPDPVNLPYMFAFRVPPLRNVELTAPYFHNGAFATLEQVVRHYNDVRASLTEFSAASLPPAVQGSYHADAVNAVLQTLDFRVQTPLRLTDAQVAELVAFLKSLTDPAARDLSAIAPASVPSGLPVR